MDGRELDGVMRSVHGLRCFSPIAHLYFVISHHLPNSFKEGLLVRIIAQINSMANVRRKGRDDLDASILEKAALPDSIQDSFLR